ncbi:MAG: hypothetical protein GXO43_03835 [Crenarchaeota archaeon]|nr:hypothetical protein [Thermoproteota archaeon]
MEEDLKELKRLKDELKRNPELLKDLKEELDVDVGSVSLRRDRYELQVMTLFESVQLMLVRLNEDGTVYEEILEVEVVEDEELQELLEELLEEREEESALSRLFG